MTVNQLIELLLPAERYILAAEKLEVTRAQLNGYELKLRVHDELLALRSQHTEFGQVELAPPSMTFLGIEAVTTGPQRTVVPHGGSHSGPRQPSSGTLPSDES